MIHAKTCKTVSMLYGQLLTVKPNDIIHQCHINFAFHEVYYEPVTPHTCMMEWCDLGWVCNQCYWTHVKIYRAVGSNFNLVWPSAYDGRNCD